MAFQPTVLRHRSVAARTGMTLIAEGGDAQVSAELKFNSCDPFAIRIVFSVDSAPSVEWVFSRELLIDGITGPAGTGDVQVFPCPAGIVFELSSPNGRARLLADAEAIGSFAQDTLDLVPLGAESRYFDLDREVALLAGSPLPRNHQS